MKSTKDLKKKYKPTSKLEVFYKGGMAIKWSNVGDILACSCDSEIKLISVETGNVIKTIEGDGEIVTALCFSSDDKILFFATRSCLLHHWHIENMELIRTIRVHKTPIIKLKMNNKKKYLISMSTDNNAYIWNDFDAFTTHVRFKKSGNVTDVCYHPKTNGFYTCCQGHDIQYLNFKGDCDIQKLKGHKSIIHCICITKDAKYLISSGTGNVIIIHELEKELEKPKIIPVYEAIKSMVLIKYKLNDEDRDHLIVVGGEKGKIKIFDMIGHLIYTENDENALSNSVIQHIEIKKNRLFIAREDGSLIFKKIIEIDNKIELEKEKFIISFNEEITALQWLETSKVIVATNDPILRIYDVSNFNCISAFSGHTEAILCISLHASKRYLATGSRDCKIIIWDIEDNKKLITCEIHSSAVTALKFSKKQSSNYLISVSDDGILKLLDCKEIGKVEYLKVIASVKAHQKDINAIDICKNDNLICTGSQDRTAKIYEIPILNNKLILNGHKRGIWSVAFSPIEKCIATASSDSTIKIWDQTKGYCLKTLEGHVLTIHKIIFLSNGKQILSGGGDGVMKLWNIYTGDCINTFDEHEDRIWDLALSSDNIDCYMASGGSDGTLIIWKDSTESDKKETFEKMKEEAKNDQDLKNALKIKDYALASKIAFNLGRPGKLLEILKEYLRKESDRETIRQIIETLTIEDLGRCLEYIREWNTNTRNYEEAHILLKCILENHSIDTLIKIPNGLEVLNGIDAYSHRHYDRVDRLIRNTYLLDYTLECMDVLLSNENIDDMVIDNEDIDEFKIKEEIIESKMEE